jgi:hypothetical protein
MNVDGMKTKEIYEVACAMHRSVKRDIFLNNAEYKWKIGALAGTALTNMVLPKVVVKQDEVMTLFGLPMDIDFVNPYKLELWKKVKDI